MAFTITLRAETSAGCAVDLKYPLVKKMNPFTVNLQYVRDDFPCGGHSKITPPSRAVKVVKAFPLTHITGEYFRIYAEMNLDPVFMQILKEARLDDVFRAKYQMVVNTGGREPFIVIGEYKSPDVELDPEAYRYDWLFFSKPVRDRLLKYEKKIMLR